MEHLTGWYYHSFKILVYST